MFVTLKIQFDEWVISENFLADVMAEFLGVQSVEMGTTHRCLDDADHRRRDRLSPS